MEAGAESRPRRDSFAFAVRKNSWSLPHKTLLSAVWWTIRCHPYPISNRVRRGNGAQPNEARAEPLPRREIANGRPMPGVNARTEHIFTMLDVVSHLQCS